MKRSAVKKYYDDYITEQYKIGVNDRIFILYEKLISFGLSNESDVVELGCGIGAVTHLIRKTVSVGQIESVDISGESIEFAKGKIKNSNVQFYEADITEYSPKIKTAERWLMSPKSFGMILGLNTRYINIMIAEYNVTPVDAFKGSVISVSYTHLTLPTKA